MTTTGAYAIWLLALGFGAAMLSLGINLGMLAKPSLWTRCGACGRVTRRSRVCPCSRHSGS
jgi:hypothetical protein